MAPWKTTFPYQEVAVHFHNCCMEASPFFLFLPCVLILCCGSRADSRRCGLLISGVSCFHFAKNLKQLWLDLECFDELLGE